MTEDALPESAVDEAERLTRLARRAVDEDEAKAYRRERDELLAEHGYAARIRDDDDGETLVCYPTEWLEDGTIRVDAVEDVSRGVEVALSGTGSDRDWETVHERNDEVATAVAERHGDVHGATARALADFASNHYAKPIEALTRVERQEFREEYFERNAWPSDAQRERLVKSVQLALELAEDDAFA
jgi:hypothetical protein